MAELRTITATLSTTVTCNDGSNVTFNSPSYGSAVYGSTCVGGEVILSRMRAWASSYHFEVYIGGQKAFETRSIDFQSEVADELKTYINPDKGINSDLVLNGSGPIQIYVYRDSGNASDICSFRSNCNLTINAYYEENSGGGDSGGGSGSYGYCTPPSNLQLSASETSDKVTLTWRAGGPGDGGNVVSGYLITCRYSTNGTSFGAVDYFTEVSGTSLTISVQDYLQTGAYMMFGVQTVGIAGTDYASSVVWSSPVRRIESQTACKGPEWCVLDQYYTAGEGVKITWGAGTPGQNNPIIRYDIWCKEYDANDNGVGDWFTVPRINANALEEIVYPPDTPGNYHYYWIHTVGQNASNDADDYEGCYVDRGLTRVTLCKGPSWCRLSKTESASESVTLSWGAGTPGVENPIAYYAVWKALCDPDGDYPEDDLWEHVGETSPSERSMQVVSPNTPGRHYLFSVWSVGENYWNNDVSEWRDSENLLRRTHEAFGAWTDPVLIQNETIIKAIHMTEMQERVNTLLSFYGKSTASFTPVVSGQTSLAGWTQHIMQIRNAIDSMNSTHDAWISIPENKPTVAVMNQIRNIISSL